MNGGRKAGGFKMFREILALWSKADLLQQSFKIAGEMLEITNEMYAEVIQSTIGHEQQRFDVHKRDKELNVMEKEIRRKVLEHLAISPSQDVVASLVLVTVVGDIERIGDYSKNVEELRQLYPEDFSSLGQIETLKRCSQQVASEFDLIREAFNQADSDKAREAIVLHKQVRNETNAVIEKAFHDPAEEKKEALVSVLFARYLKRISAHLKNIATSVVNPFDEIGYTKPPKVSDE